VRIGGTADIEITEVVLGPNPVIAIIDLPKKVELLARLYLRGAEKKRGKNAA